MKKIALIIFSYSILFTSCDRAIVQLQSDCSIVKSTADQDYSIINQETWSELGYIPLEKDTTVIYGFDTLQLRKGTILKKLSNN